MTDVEEAPGDDWDLPSPYCHEIEVASEDIDAFGHANNAVYLRWLEAAVWAHSKHAAGYGMRSFRELGRAMVVRHTELDYLAPAFEGDRIEVANWIVGSDRVSARRQFQVRRCADRATLLRASILYVCIDLASGRPRRKPPEFLDRYGVLPEVRAALVTAGRDPDRPRPR